MVSPNNHELFAIKLLLQEISARSFDEVKEKFPPFWEAAAERGMVENGQEFLTIMEETIKIHRPSSEVRNLMIILYETGADFKFLFNEFRSYLEQDLIKI